jgi:type IV secretion system protein VirB11
MTTNHQRPEAIARSARMLRTALGPAIARLLEDPAVVEVMLNPDGRLWVDRLSEGLSDTGERLSAADGERIVRLVAHHVGAEVHARSPRVSAELPESGERFEGLLPPVVAAPAFAIRKPAVAVFSLDDYVAAGIMSADQAATLRAAVSSRANILVAGGTSTGNAPRPIWSPCGRKTAWRRFPIWSGPRCACAPTVFPSARCAVPKPSTF